MGRSMLSNCVRAICWPRLVICQVLGGRCHRARGSWTLDESKRRPRSPKLQVFSVGDRHIGGATEAGTLGKSVGVWAGLEEAFPLLRAETLLLT